MALSKYRLGDLIKVVDERNSFGIKKFMGLNINKEFMPTNANTEGLDETKYKVVRNKRFVFSGMQTGRDQCIRISMYQNDDFAIVSPAYTTFEVSRIDLIIPDYFFMIFLSKEKDRYGAFCSDGSIRTNLDWDVFCNIIIDLPNLETQEKFVNIYKSMLKNQEQYERGLNDLKLTCDAYIEDLRRNMYTEPIGDYIQEESSKNKDLKINNVKGVNSSSSFDETKANIIDLDFHNYKIVKNEQFAYNPSRINVGSIALYDGIEDCIVSPMYIVFSCINKSKLLPQYLMMWLSRKEFLRSTKFYAMGSVRDTFDFSLMKEVEIPIPSLEIQQSIVNIYKIYKERKQINEKLKEQIKNICPILIKGAIEEAREV